MNVPDYSKPIRNSHFEQMAENLSPKEVIDYFVAFSEENGQLLTTLLIHDYCIWLCTETTEKPFDVVQFQNVFQKTLILVFDE